MRMWFQPLALLSGLRIWSCHELWCSSQMRLGSHVGVAVVEAGSYSSDWIPSLGTSICRECGPKRDKKTKKKKELSLEDGLSWVNLKIPQMMASQPPCGSPLGPEWEWGHLAESGVGQDLSSPLGTPPIPSLPPDARSACDVSPGRPGQAGVAEEVEPPSEPSSV